MASVYTRSGSRFWWIKYRDPRTGERVRESTGIDIAITDARRKAKRLEAEKTRDEMSAPRIRETECWEGWVSDYIEARYLGRGSVKNARKALVDLLAYFREFGIRTPRQVDYKMAAGFLKWRASGKTLPVVSPNTIRQRFVYFSIIMAEAVRREYCPFNPCRDVECHGVKPKEKREITAAHQAIIEEALKSKGEWMQEQWLVLMRQGCRVAESSPPLEWIDTESMNITMKIKGGRMHTAKLHPDILPLVEKAKKEGRKTLLNSSAQTGNWSSMWSQFFKKLGLPYSIHCTRVTVITRLVRAGHSVVQICNFIGHTAEVNRIYRKLKPADSEALLATLAGASS